MGSQGIFYCSDDGPGTSACVCGPPSVAVCGAGDVYIADTRNIGIRVISPTTMPTPSLFASRTPYCSASQYCTLPRTYLMGTLVGSADRRSIPRRVRDGLPPSLLRRGCMRCLHICLGIAAHVNCCSTKPGNVTALVPSDFAMSGAAFLPGERRWSRNSTIRSLSVAALLAATVHKDAVAIRSGVHLAFLHPTAYDYFFRLAHCNTVYVPQDVKQLPQASLIGRNGTHEHVRLNSCSTWQSVELRNLATWQFNVHRCRVVVCFKRRPRGARVSSPRWRWTEHCQTFAPMRPPTPLLTRRPSAPLRSC